MSFLLKLVGMLYVTISLFLVSVNVSYADQIILTIKGKIESGDAKDYSLKDLMQFPSRKIETHTPWHDGLVQFEGVTLSDLMEDAKGYGDEIRVSALNDYSALLPISDVQQYEPILAYKFNNSLMRIEDKGPLFVIYPFDSNTELQAEVFYARSVWQVRTITFK